MFLVQMIIKKQGENGKNMFSHLELSFCCVFDVRSKAAMVVAADSAWGLRYSLWRGHSRKILIEKIPGEEEL